MKGLQGVLRWSRVYDGGVVLQVLQVQSVVEGHEV